MLRETVGSQHFNQVFWQNDPDVLLIRDFHVQLNDNQTTSLALWQSILGGVVATSDPLHEISEARQALWKFVQPSTAPGTASLPFLTQPDRPLVAVRSLATGDHVVLIFNTSDRHVLERIRLSELGIDGQRHAFMRDVVHSTYDVVHNTHDVVHSTHDVVYSTHVGCVDELLVALDPHASAAFHVSLSNTAPAGPLINPEFTERPKLPI